MIEMVALPSVLRIVDDEKYVSVGRTLNLLKSPIVSAVADMISICFSICAVFDY